MKLILITAALLVGCTNGDIEMADGDSGSPSAPPPSWTPPGADGDAPGEDAATGANTPNGRPSGQADAAPSPPPGAGASIPCDVSRVLGTYCATCHAETPIFGAPMPLVTLEDLKAPVPGQPGKRMHDLVIERMDDAARPMPPAQSPIPEAADVARVRAWVESGAPAGEACEGEVQPPGADPRPPLPPPNPECDYVFELRAHGSPVPNDDSPYMVPPLKDLYVNFSFQVPWVGEAQAIEFHPIVDDARVLHHYLLYTFPVGGALANGSILPGFGMHPAESLVAGWAPGGSPTVMPANVGLQMPAGPTGRMTLEVHYHNETGVAVPDRSGVRACVTTRKRPEAAAVSLLGTELIAAIGPGEHRFTGICTPVLNVLTQTPVHILTSGPHMHRRGRHITTKIHRTDGTVDVLLDVPFDFDNQVIYQTPNTIYPGDWLETTCTYESEGPFIFGIRTEDEMCQNYLTTWPAGLLDTGGSLILEAHACML
jgi:hypothetical protein